MGGPKGWLGVGRPSKTHLNLSSLQFFFRILWLTVAQSLVLLSLYRQVGERCEKLRWVEGSFCKCFLSWHVVANGSQSKVYVQAKLIRRLQTNNLAGKMMNKLNHVNQCTICMYITSLFCTGKESDAVESLQTLLDKRQLHLWTAWSLKQCGRPLRTVTIGI